MHADIPTHMTVDEAISALHLIRAACRDINFKVMTTDDIMNIVLGVDTVQSMTETELNTARQMARDSWELRHWADMQEGDWMQVEDALDADFVVKMSDKYEEE